jgi:hypothetical protein
MGCRFGIDTVAVDHAGGCFVERGGDSECNKDNNSVGGDEDKGAVDGNLKVAPAMCVVWLERKNALKGGSPGVLMIEREQHGC